MRRNKLNQTVAISVGLSGLCKAVVRIFMSLDSLVAQREGGKAEKLKCSRTERNCCHVYKPCQVPFVPWAVFMAQSLVMGFDKSFTSSERG